MVVKQPSVLWTLEDFGGRQHFAPTPSCALPWRGRSLYQDVISLHSTSIFDEFGVQREHHTRNSPKMCTIASCHDLIACNMSCSSSEVSPDQRAHTCSVLLPLTAGPDGPLWTCLLQDWDMLQAPTTQPQHACNMDSPKHVPAKPLQQQQNELWDQEILSGTVKGVPQVVVSHFNLMVLGESGLGKTVSRWRTIRRCTDWAVSCQQHRTQGASVLCCQRTASTTLPPRAAVAAACIHSQPHSWPACQAHWSRVPAWCQAFPDCLSARSSQPEGGA